MPHSRARPRGELLINRKLFIANPLLSEYFDKSIYTAREHYTPTRKNPCVCNVYRHSQVQKRAQYVRDILAHPRGSFINHSPGLQVWNNKNPACRCRAPRNTGLRIEGKKKHGSRATMAEDFYEEAYGLLFYKQVCYKRCRDTIDRWVLYIHREQSGRGETSKTISASGWRRERAVRRCSVVPVCGRVCGWRMAFLGTTIGVADSREGGARARTNSASIAGGELHVCRPRKGRAARAIGVAREVDRQRCLAFSSLWGELTLLGLDESSCFVDK